MNEPDGTILAITLAIILVLAFVTFLYGWMILDCGKRLRRLERERKW